MNKQVKSVFLSKKWEILGSFLLLAVFIVPAMSFASASKIYVDDSATGTEDGSSSHPYNTIKEALKEADEDTEVHIAAGNYEENIEIPKGVEVYGSDKDEVIIKADSDDEPVVKMNHKTKINKVTVKDGEYGIKVGKNDKVSIIKCVIKDNDKDGINIKMGDIDNKKKVSITDSIIKNNGRAGIYSEKRRIVIMDSDIINNNSDGIDLAAGSKAWVEGNRIKDNDGSGLKLVLDDSDVWTKGNSVRNNKREGVEVSAFGKPGRIDIKKSKFYNNGRYGVVKIQRADFAATIWSGLTVQGDNEFFENKMGSVSNIIRAF